MSAIQKKVRFTVSLDEEDHKRLVKLGDSHSPKLTRQYLVNFAILQLLKNAEEPQIEFTLGNPINKTNL